MLLEENSVDVNQNLTEMNLVNDVTGLSQNASQIQIINDNSQVTLTNVNVDQTQSQVILDIESASVPQRRDIMTRNNA